MKSDAEARILDAAFKVVNERTISGTRVHLIAKECGMVQSNLHYYFKTKRDLLVALLDSLQDMFTETRLDMMSRFPDTLSGQLQGILEQKKYIITEAPEYDRVQMDYWNQGQIDSTINQSIDNSYRRWREHICETILKYEPELPHEKVNIIAHIMVSMMFGASLQYLCNPSTFDLDVYFTTCLAMIEQQLGA